MTRLLAVLVVLMLSIASARATERIDYGDYYALVIGNNDYVHLPRLETAVSDAAAVAELLRSSYAFKDVTLLLNATRADILRHMNQLRADLTENDNLLIYYAGHGYVDRSVDEGYWQPVDAEESDDTNWIKNDRLTDYLRSMSAKHILVVADSCYSGTLTRSSGGGPAVGAERQAWLQRMSEKRARLALSSGGVEPVLDQGPKGHSVFADAFLAALRDNEEILDGQSLFQRLKRQVVLNAQQTPQYADIRNAAHEGGDFLFVPKDVTTATAAPTETKGITLDVTNLAALDLALWASVKDSEDAAMYTAYLSRFPTGTFAAIAKLRIQQIRAKDELPPLAPVFARSRSLAPVEAPYVVLKNANVRAGPGLKADKIDMLEAGAEVRVAGRTRDGEWLAVRHGDGLAYVYAPLLREKDRVAVR